MRVTKEFRSRIVGFHSALDRMLSVLLAFLMAGAPFNVVWQIASRYGLGDPSLWTDELARYLLVWLGILGAAAALGRNAHLAVDILPRDLSGRFLVPLRVGCDLLVGVFAASVLVFGGSRLVKMSFDLGQSSPAMGIPMGFVYGVIPMAGLLMVFFSVHSLVLHASEEGGSGDA